ncbi:1-aminocyclopropane-1-carboxylate deaminase/D-cysteine desulfhydrase [Lewinella sp. LCG006]|uniref:1-aminocyclopropane-1-carboxylate deaminase/D-cysteine desulfhydrase n=1 Tax=Lewinella sp. LCG006 TaxID=3231911 RepID=UPI003460D8BE
MNFADLKSPPPSPLVLLDDQQWEDRDVQLYIKRDDLLAPQPNDPFCGNKWRKLQYNLLRAKDEGFEKLLTFGGAYSNHLAAVASAGRHLGFATLGMVRGDKVENPTLALAQQNGMELHFVDRTTYRLKGESEYLRQLEDRFGKVYILPEGGTNPLAYPGCAALAEEIIAQCTEPPTHLALACGTGGTLTGLLSGLPDLNPPEVIGISALKGNFMAGEIQQQLTELALNTTKWEVHSNYHHGGYARQSPALMAFIQTFYQRHGILLEPVYTGKLFFALYALLAQGYFPAGSRVVGIHTGGLQSFGCAV